MLEGKPGLNLLEGLLSSLPLRGGVLQMFEIVVAAVVAQYRQGDVLSEIESDVLVGRHEANCQQFAFIGVSDEDAGAFFVAGGPIDQVVVVLVNQ